jgi:DNA-binding transcriptional LysR family regulator
VDLIVDPKSCRKKILRHEVHEDPELRRQVTARGPQHPERAFVMDVIVEHGYKCTLLKLTANGEIRQAGDAGEALSIDGEGPLILDEPNLMLAAARAGFGLAFLSERNVAADLAAGSLVRVLDEWTPPFPGLALYDPGRRHVPAGLRAMIALIREKALT